MIPPIWFIELTRIEQANRNRRGDRESNHTHSRVIDLTLVAQIAPIGDISLNNSIISNVVRQNTHTHTHNDTLFV
jgi:hypothetical protein